MIVEYNEKLESYLDKELLSKDEIDFELKNNPFGKYLFYIENDKLIGYIYYSDIYERAEINKFEIELNHRNCGKGTELLQTFIKLINKDITLEVNMSNIPAIKVYEKCGFVKKCIRQGYYNGVDGILMEIKLRKEWSYEGLIYIRYRK